MSYKLKHALPPRGQSVKTRADQVMNSAGGQVFALDDLKRLERFLILGVDGPTYYASARALTLDNAQCVARCLDRSPARALELITAISDAGRAPRNDAAIFALAIASAHPDQAVRSLALTALPKVCRTGTHLFQFVDQAVRLRRWGRGLRRAVAHWYLDLGIDRLVYQVLKYGAREGYTHRDLLRLAHPKPELDAQRAVFRWLCAEDFHGAAAGERPEWLGALPAACHGFDALRATGDAAPTEAEAIALIRRHRFTHDMIPSEWKRSKGIWEALLPEMPLTALLRALAQLTNVGVLAPGSDAVGLVCRRLTDAAALKKARVHPIAVLAASKVYSQGHGQLGKLTWKPVPAIVNALDTAFHLAFRAITPAGKRFLIGLDVSGSMTCGSVGGLVGLDPRTASAVMALSTLRAEPHCDVLGFSHQLVPVPLTGDDSLKEAISKIDRVPMGATDCALPILHALKHRIPVDVFAIYTDNETWFGNVHPYAALQQYREAMGLPAKLAVIGLTSTGFSIADPNDAGSLDLVGFDAAAPAVLSDFARAAA